MSTKRLTGVFTSASLRGAPSGQDESVIHVMEVNGLLAPVAHLWTSLTRGLS